MLHQRYLKLDEYVAAHKVLDHVWRKWIFADFRPAFALVYDEKATEIPQPTSPFKNILKDFADLKDKTKTMTEKQAKEWNDAGFSYEAVQDWINVGLNVSDADFVNWLVHDKSKENPNYANPEWILNHAGIDSVPSIEDLRAEFET